MQESESASETSSVHSGDASDRRDIDITVNFWTFLPLGVVVFSWIFNCSDRFPDAGLVFEKRRVSTTVSASARRGEWVF